MIIPVRCFTCGAVIADKWVQYNTLTNEYRKDTKHKDVELLDIDALTSNDNPVTAEYKALQDLDITRVCCRRHFLCNVDMIDQI
ncbi:MAG: DNA-directed RNA polymerase subunit N [Paracoccaceae bacterium]|nr:MAG: DNA-directed RNA polymerase subunit N [Paracoccaceae bacterium]